MASDSHAKRPIVVERRKEKGRKKTPRLTKTYDVKIIPATVGVVAETEEPPKKRVAAYCRVSTDQEAQETSLEEQMAHFNTVIAEHPDWELAGIYADEGISGTQVKHRVQFQQMIEDGRLVIEPEEAKTVRFIFLAFIQGYNYDQIAAVLTQKKRSTLRGRQEWNGMMVANIMKNERRWGDLEARKSIVVDYKLGKVTKNNGNRCSAYVPEHHEAIVSPEIARAAHLVASSSKKCGVQDIVVIRQGALKGFVGIHPNWSGINAESIRSLCLSTYLPEEVMKLNDIAEMRAGATLGKALQSEYMTVSGTCFINQSSPVMTISKNGIRFSKACHSRLDDCEYVELLYHPILQVVILRKSRGQQYWMSQYGRKIHFQKSRCPKKAKSLKIYYCRI